MRFVVPTAAKKFNRRRAWGVFRPTCTDPGWPFLTRNTAVQRPLSGTSEKPLPATGIKVGRGGPCTLLLNSWNGTTPGSLAPSEGEVHLHLRVDLDRLSVQQVWLVLPLLHGFDRGRSQHRVPADQLQVLDVAFLADLRLENDHALNAGLPRQRRIRRRNLSDQKARATRPTIRVRAAG